MVPCAIKSRGMSDLRVLFLVFRPIAPMCRMHVNTCFHFRFDPTAKNTTAWKSYCMHAVCINKRQF
jgi:hypothetical protein